MKKTSWFKGVGLSLLLFVLLPLQSFAHNPEKKAGEDGNLFQQYTWVEIWNPLLFLFLGIVYFIYLRVIQKNSKSHPDERYFKQKAFFFYGLFTIYIALAGPISVLSNNLLISAHMVQQSLMYIVMPPLILAGMPHQFYKFLDGKVLSGRFLQVFRSRLLALLLFNVLWSFYHIPPIYEYFLEHTIQLELLHIVVNASAFLMWIHVMAPEGRISQMSPVLKIGYMFANGLLITPACALIIFATEVIYPSVNTAPMLFTWNEPVIDQQMGGVIMKIMQEISYGVVIASIFFKWAKTERAKDAPNDGMPKGIAN